MHSMIIDEQKIEAPTPSVGQARLREIAFKAPPGLEDQFNQWPPVDGKYVFAPVKVAEEHEEDTTCAGSGSERDPESDDDSQESPISKLSATAPEFHFSMDAPVFNPTLQHPGWVTTTDFFPTAPRTGLKSGAQLFVPGGSKTKLTSGALPFVPLGPKKAAEPQKFAKKTQLAAVTKKSELFVPEWPELNASVDMKTRGPTKP